LKEIGSWIGVYDIIYKLYRRVFIRKMSNDGLASGGRYDYQQNVGAKIGGEFNPPPISVNRVP
jgi:hypothetical protein